jgi:preprotein translocase subunit YajC
MTWFEFGIVGAATAGGLPPWLATLGLWVAILAIFYFIVFAPMRRQRQELQKLMSDLKKGDKVVTSGGLYGEVSAVQNGAVILKIAENVKVRLAKSAIAGRQEEGDAGGSR